MKRVISTQELFSALVEKFGHHEEFVVADCEEVEDGFNIDEVLHISPNRFCEVPCGLSQMEELDMIVAHFQSVQKTDN